MPQTIKRTDTPNSKEKNIAAARSALNEAVLQLDRAAKLAKAANVSDPSLCIDAARSIAETNSLILRDVANRTGGAS